MSKSIQVGIRAKPTNNNLNIWSIDSKKNKIIFNNNGSEYIYNRVFQPSIQTYEIYHEMADDVIEGFLEGYNGTIFAYGSTGSGKTFTMMGDNEHPGITPLAVQHIFEHIQNDRSREYIVGFSYFEIYNETIKDLMKPNSQRTKNIKFSQVITNSYEDLMATIKRSEENRATGATSMNEHSSRSHAIIRIALESTSVNNQGSAVRRSVLNLIDLAGSECQKDTNAEGERQREASNINKSLLALSNVINALQNKKASINYRDSKLTLYLQNSLGGNAHTVIICTISQENAQQSTTKSTLSFATKAMKVKNQVKLNEIKSEKAIIEEQKNEIARLLSEIERLKAIIESKDNNLSPKGDNSLYELSNSPISENKNINSNNSSFSFSVTEEIPCLPKKIKKQRKIPPKLDLNNISPKSNQDEILDQLDFTRTMYPIDFEPSPIRLPKKQKKSYVLNDITDDEKLSDAEADREAEQLSKEILSHNKAILCDSPSDSSEQIVNTNKELETLKTEKEELESIIKDLKSQIQEKEQLQKTNEELKLQIQEKEQLQTNIVELEKQLKIQNENSQNHIDMIKTKDTEIQSLKDEINKVKEMKIMEDEKIIENQKDEIGKLKEEIEKMKSSLFLKEAHLKGVSLNTAQLQGLIKQKDSLMAKYSDDKEKEVFLMRKQIDELTKQNSELKMQTEELISQNLELIQKNDDAQRKHDELSKIKDDVSAQNNEYSLKCDNFYKQLKETSKQNNELIKKYQNLSNENKTLRKKFEEIENSHKVPNSNVKFVSKFACAKDTTEVFMSNDSLNFSAIDKQDVSLVTTTKRIPLQPMNNITISLDKSSLKNTLLQKVQNSNLDQYDKLVNHRQYTPRNLKRKLSIENVYFFESVNQSDELDSSKLDQTHVINNSIFNQVNEDDFEVNSISNTSILADQSNSSIQILSDNANEITQEQIQNKNEKNEIDKSSDDEFIEDCSINESSSDENDSQLDFKQLCEIHRSNIEFNNHHNHLSDFLNLFTILMLFFAYIGMFIFDI